MSWRRAGLIPALLLAATACASDLGPGTPACPEGPDANVAAITILQLQAVPDAKWGPCIAELKVGWEYSEHFTESGRSSFWLDSDRMGDRFIEARLTSQCDTTGALPAPHPQPGVERLIRVREQPGPIQLAIIPVAPRHRSYAGAVLAELDGVRVEGRALAPFVPVSNAPAAVQIERALGNGQIAVIVDDREEANGTIEVRRPGAQAEVGIRTTDLIEEIEDDLGHPRYRAEWFHRFEGGCITYFFDAEGSGAETVVEEIDDVLGLYPLAELRRGARAQGWEV